MRWWNWLRESPRSPVRPLYGFDLDDLPFNRAKDAYGPFTSLAGFAVAQSVALTAVARGDRNKWIVLGVYAMAVFVTLVWTVSLLRSELDKDDQPPPDDLAAGQPDPRPDRLRAYDRTSITYGRWTLNWIVFVAALMVLLGWYNLLPNQTTRVDFYGFPIYCEALPVGARQGPWPPIGGSALERGYMDVWIGWLAKSVPDAPKKQQLVWIEQKGKFTANHNSVTGRLACNSNLKVRGRAAFLVRSDQGSSRPVYRQMAFALDNALETDVLRLHEPNENEFLIIVALLEAVNAEGDRLLQANGPYDVVLQEDK